MSKPERSLHLINHPATKGFATCVGKFLLNCGALEFATLAWFDLLSNSLPDRDNHRSQLFRPRIRAVKELVNALAIPDPLRVACLKSWENCDRIAGDRNLFAHNPLLVGWPGEDTGGPPSVLQVLDLRTLGKGTLRVLTGPQLEGLVNEASTLARELEWLLDQVVAAVGGPSKRTPPTP